MGCQAQSQQTKQDNYLKYEVPQSHILEAGPKGSPVKNETKVFVQPRIVL